ESDGGHAPAAVVLEAAVDPVRFLVAHGDVVELADRRGVKVVPGGGPVVADVVAAVAADQHVPAVLRVDPHRMAVGMYVLAGAGLELLAAVGALVLADAQHVDVLVIRRIDADDAEVHRPRVDAVDTLPGLAAVVGAVDAAVLPAVGALRVLHVLDLPAELAHVGPVLAAALAAAAETAAALELRRLGEGQVDLAGLVLALDGEGHLVADGVLVQFVAVVVAGLDRLVVQRRDDVADLQAGLHRGAVFHDVGDAVAALGVLAEEAGERPAGESLALGRRVALADVLAIHHG